MQGPCQGKVNLTSQPMHATCQQEREGAWNSRHQKIRRWAGFSAVNPTYGRKVRLLRLNTQTPCPPRSAVPANSEGRGRLFRSVPSIRTSAFAEATAGRVGNGC